MQAAWTELSTRFDAKMESCQSKDDKCGCKAEQIYTEKAD